MAFNKRTSSLLDHPILPGIWAAVRIMVPLYLISVGVSAAVWLVGSDQLLPLGVIPGWAARGVAWAAGFTLSGAGISVSLPPTLVSCLIGLAAFRSMRSTLESEDAQEELAGQRTRSLHHLLGFILTAAAVLALCMVLTHTPADPLGVVRALIIIAVAPAVGLRLGVYELADRLESYLDMDLLGSWEEAHLLLRRTLIGLLMGAHIILGLGILLTLMHGNSPLEGYSSVLAAGIGLGLVQLLFAPTAWVSSLMWATGLPVSLSGGADYSALFGSEAPRPSVPVMTLAPAHPMPWLIALAAVPILCAAGAVLLRRRWYVHLDRATLCCAGIQLLLVGAAASFFIRGGIGPGGLAAVGPPWWATLGGFGLWAVLGYGLAYTMLWLSRRSADQPDADV